MKRSGLASCARILAVLGAHAAILIAICAAGRSTTSVPKRLPSPVWEPPTLSMSFTATISARRPIAPCAMLLPVPSRPAESGGAAADQAPTTSSLLIDRPDSVEYTASEEGCWPGQRGGSAE